MVDATEAQEWRVAYWGFSKHRRANAQDPPPRSGSMPVRPSTWRGRGDLLRLEVTEQVRRNHNTHALTVQPRADLNAMSARRRNPR
jgi:hypothetical protein